MWGLPNSACKKVGRAALDHRIKKWSIVPSWISQLTFNNRLFVPGNTCPDQAEVCLNNRKPLAWQTCEPGGRGWLGVLNCTVNNEVSPTGEFEFRANLFFAELRAVFYLTCFRFRFLITHLFVVAQKWRGWMKNDQNKSQRPDNFMSVLRAC